jgi:hypothetical protein
MVVGLFAAVVVGLVVVGLVVVGLAVAVVTKGGGAVVVRAVVGNVLLKRGRITTSSPNETAAACTAKTCLAPWTGRGIGGDSTKRTVVVVPGVGEATACTSGMIGGRRPGNAASVVAASVVAASVVAASVVAASVVAASVVAASAGASADAAASLSSFMRKLVTGLGRKAASGDASG